MKKFRQLNMLFRLSFAMGRRDPRAIRRHALGLLKLDPTDTLVLGALAGALAELGELAESIEVWRSLLDIKPDHLGALQALATYTADRGDHRQAYEYLKRAVAAIPGEPTLPPRLLVAVMNAVGVIVGRRGLGSRALRQAEAAWADQQRWKASVEEDIHRYDVHPS